MKTSLSISVLSFGVLVLSCDLSPSADCAEQLTGPSQTGPVTNTTNPPDPAKITIAVTTPQPPPNPPAISVANELCEEQAVELGGTAVFSIKNNSPDVLFQWLFQGERIPNATNSFLVLPKLTFENAGYYTCVVYQGFDFEMSKPMQLLVFQRNEEGIKVAAKTPPGLGGMWDAPIKVEKKTALLESVNPAPTVAIPASARGGSAGIASLGNNLMSLAQLTFMMQSTNYATGALYSPVSGTGCPRPYQGYIRFTKGWYLNSAAASWKVSGTGGTSTYSAITFDDTTRQRCNYGNTFDLASCVGCLPLRFDKPHRFVCFFATTPSSTTTYYIQLTGFL